MWRARVRVEAQTYGANAMAAGRHCEEDVYARTMKTMMIDLADLGKNALGLVKKKVCSGMRMRAMMVDLRRYLLFDR